MFIINLIPNVLDLFFVNSNNKEKNDDMKNINNSISNNNVNLPKIK
jgi:hypothetical protein